MSRLRRSTDKPITIREAIALWRRLGARDARGQWAPNNAKVAAYGKTLKRRRRAEEAASLITRSAAISHSFDEMVSQETQDLVKMVTDAEADDMHRQRALMGIPPVTGMDNP